MSVEFEGWAAHVSGVTAEQAARNIKSLFRGSAVGKPKEKIRIEPVSEPIPEKTPAPVETPSEPIEVPEKEPAGV